MNLQKYLRSGLVVLVVVCGAVPAFAGAPARGYTGVVTHVSDGDTLWVRTAQQAEPVKVRLQGMDAPESCQAWGREATAALKDRALYQTVQLQSRTRDTYGRMVARASLRGEDLGRWMVANGHAWSYGWRGRSAPYAAEQLQAQAARRGLWAQAAMEPRAFRKRHGSCAH